MQDYTALLDRARAGARPELDVEAMRAKAPAEPTVTPYARSILHVDDAGEVMVATWRAGGESAVHDHGGSGGFVIVLSGRVTETRYRWDEHGLVACEPVVHEAGAAFRIGQSIVHRVTAESRSITLHLYAPAPCHTRVHDLANRKSYVLREGHGAWLPESDSEIVQTEAWSDVAHVRARPVFMVGYTTHYREGSEDFARAAKTIARDLEDSHPSAEIRIVPLRWKRDFVGYLEGLARDARTLQELHFIGHSGMYGIMFGSTEWPEQLSPHEWRTLHISFGENARAVFHACRTGRWFAAFIARTFGVRALGHHGYTTVSLRSDRFVWAAPYVSRKKPLHVISCVGRKSHGYGGAARKHLGAKAEPLREFDPVPAGEAPSYDAVASMYDAAFSDLRVRGPELAFVKKAIGSVGHGRALDVLDFGCGNGSLLEALGSRVAVGVGVDVSRGMIERARERHRERPHLSFERISGPILPFADHSFDLVVSFLSFRYLDWDPALREIARVLRPNGKFVIVDMVDKPIALREAPLLVQSSLRHAWTRVRHRAFVKRLEALTTQKPWAEMLSYNPIRAEHEYRWYLESRFPGQKLEILSASRVARVVAFDSGPKSEAWKLVPMAFP